MLANKLVKHTLLINCKFELRSIFNFQIPGQRRRNFCSSGDQYVIKSRYPDVTLPNTSLHRLIWKNISRWPHHIAVECALTGKKYTYEELHLKSRKFGSSLKKIGLNSGDSVAIILPNIPEYPVAYLGLLESGLVPTTMNPNLTKDEFIYQMEQAEVKCVVCHPTNIKTLLAAKQEMKKDLKIISTNNFDGRVPPNNHQNEILFEELIINSVDLSESYDANMNDVAITSFSSGTTGLPKATCLTHRALTASIAQISSPLIQRIYETHGDYQDVVPGILPLFHIYGKVTVMLNAFCKGAKFVTLPKFDRKHFLHMLINNKNLMLYVVPPMVFYMGNAEEVTSKYFKGVREILTSAAPCKPSDIDKIRQKISNKVLLSQGYGMTECTTLITVCSHDEARHRSTVGQLIPNTLSKVIDTNGTTLPPSTQGELCFKGQQMMKEYFKNPQATTEMIDSDGWLHSGDIGYYDNDGYFFITDRIKDMIKVKGYQVAPAEIEGVLRRHPGISEAGVVGISCEESGETPVAFVQLKPGELLSEKEVVNFLSTHLARYKLVSAVRFVQDIPMTPSGKILRKQLKNML